MALIYSEKGPQCWTPTSRERYPSDLPSPTNPQTKSRLLCKRFSPHFSKIAPDGSKVVVAEKKRLFVSEVIDENAATREIPVDFSLTRDDEIIDVDISADLLVVLTLKNLVLFSFIPNIKGDAEVNKKKMVPHSRNAQSPSCLCLSQAASWAWVAVGKEQCIELYLFRKDMITSVWSLKTDRPKLRYWSEESISQIEIIAASPNQSQNPNASIFAGSCGSYLSFWDLRARSGLAQTMAPTGRIAVPAEQSQSSARRITSLTIFLSPLGCPYVACTMFPARERKTKKPKASFIMPIAPPVAPAEVVETALDYLEEFQFKGGDAVLCGHVGLSHPYLAVIKKREPALLVLSGGTGRLRSVLSEVQFDYEMNVRDRRFRGVCIRSINLPDKLRIITVDYKANLRITEFSIAGLPGPPVPPPLPPRPPVEMDGNGLHRIWEADSVSATSSHQQEARRRSAASHTRSNSSATFDLNQFSVPTRSGSGG